MQFDRTVLRACRFLVGPTAVGKTEIGIEVARRLGGEVVALDSMTVYRGLEIGTAKPSLVERDGVPHHLFDLVDPWEEFTVARYVVEAERVCREILARGRAPVFVGGSGLYLRTILRGLFDGPEADPAVRGRLEVESQQFGPDALHRRLQAVDPVAAARLHPNDVRRVIRALEVFELTGTPLSEQQRQGPLQADERPVWLVWLEPDRAWLQERIDRRVDAMLAAGLVAETQAVLAAGGFGPTAAQALGYAEVLEHLAGKSSLEGCREAIQTHTRQFAKRQCTWFRNLEELSAVPVDGATDRDELARRLAQR